MIPADEIDIVEEDAPPPPAGVPAGFRELLALALKTTDPTALDQAERDYRGVHPSVHHYLMTELAHHLPPDLDWLPASCGQDQLRQIYEGHVGRALWVIRLYDGRVMVFESVRTARSSASEL